MGSFPKGHIHFPLQKFNPLNGRILISLILTIHLFSNVLRTADVLPCLFWVEVLFVLSPLLFHSSVGIYIPWVTKFSAPEFSFHPLKIGPTSFNGAR